MGNLQDNTVAALPGSLVGEEAAAALRRLWDRQLKSWLQGDRISVEGSDVYVVRVSCYPLEDIVRFTGYGSKKDGKPSQSSVTATVKERSVVQKHGQSLDEATLSSLYFEGSSRLPNVKQFLQDEIAKLP